MRIWSIHPEYLDSKGLTALWRETLLAKNVLEGNTKGYKNHPQLNRFRATEDPVSSINHYLSFVYYEAKKRGFNFDRRKIDWDFHPIQIKVTRGQLEFEKNHMLKKLKVRDKGKFKVLAARKNLKSHPQFKLINGEIEDWKKN
jgi:hypothetical protein